MSNLLKQYYITSIPGNARIIDSNKRADSIIKEHEAGGFSPLNFAELTPSNDQEGFKEGILAENVKVVEPVEQAEDTDNISEKIRDMLDSAQKQADDIISEAQNKANKLLDDAKSKAQQLYDENRKKGYEDGAQDKLADVMKMQEGVEAEINQKKNELEEVYRRKSDMLEGDIVDAIIQVFNKVFNIQFDDKREMLLHLIKNTLMNVEVGKEFRIHVSQNNYKFINSHLDDVRQSIGNDVNVEVVNDASLGTGDCQIETNFGVFDCGIDMELNNLIKDIKSLCC